MKKLLFTAAAISLLALAGLAFSNANGQAADEGSDQIIMTYFPMSAAPYVVGKGPRAGIRIYYGHGKIENITLTDEQQNLPVSNTAAETLSKLRGQGYLLTSTNIVGSGAGSEVYCFLGKR